MFYMWYITLYDFQEILSTSKENEKITVFIGFEFFCMTPVWFLECDIWSLCDY